MKTRYKVLIVITGTIFVYMAIIPGLLFSCLSFTDECSIFQELLLYTYLTVPGTLLGDEHDGIGEWTGTVEGIEEPRLDYFLQNNVGFISFFVIVPFLIIIVLIIRDKKKTLNFGEKENEN